MVLFRHNMPAASLEGLPVVMQPWHAGAATVKPSSPSSLGVRRHVAATRPREGSLATNQSLATGAAIYPESPYPPNLGGVNLQNTHVLQCFLALTP